MTGKDEKKQLSHVYIHHDYVDETTPIDPPYRNACYYILRDSYSDLPEYVQEQFDDYDKKVDREAYLLRLWARDFRRAYKYGDPLPARMGLGRTVDVDTSTLKGAEDLKSMERAFFAVLQSGSRGVTSTEARIHGERGGGISGALTKLHQAGAIARLSEVR